jgi:hypothetical protein
MDTIMEDLLFLTQRIPYPPIKGEKIRPLQILKHLRQFYSVHLGCLVDDPRDLEHVDTVRATVLTSRPWIAGAPKSRALAVC